MYHQHNYTPAYYSSEFQTQLEPIDDLENPSVYIQFKYLFENKWEGFNLQIALLTSERNPPRQDDRGCSCLPQQGFKSLSR